MKRIAALIVFVFLGRTVSAVGADLPKFGEVEATVRDVLSEEKDYRPGDLLTRKQVKAMLDRIERLGWKLTDRSALEKKVLDDGSYLVGKLSTSSGKKFMRQIAEMSLAYDRLDRLSQLPQGRHTVERLIRGPDGYKLFDYMANNKGGRELAKMLSKDGKGDFNQPTGKLYTDEQFLRELKTLYAAALQRP
jgi:hypothetical protein